MDREERPDLDQIYQSALLAQRHGGWPLTVFLAPDQTPFFAGTYFPKMPRYRLPGFIKRTENVSSAWHNRRGEVLAQNEAVREALSRESVVQPGPASLDTRPFDDALRDFEGVFDPEWGVLARAQVSPAWRTCSFCCDRPHTGRCGRATWRCSR